MAARKTRPAIDGEDQSGESIYTVAPRRSLQVEGRTVRAGEEVILDDDEADELIAHGFLVDPAAPEPTLPTGPQIARETA